MEMRAVPRTEKMIMAANLEADIVRALVVAMLTEDIVARAWAWARVAVAVRNQYEYESVT